MWHLESTVAKVSLHGDTSGALSQRKRSPVFPPSDGDGSFRTQLYFSVVLLYCVHSETDNVALVCGSYWIILMTRLRHTSVASVKLDLFVLWLNTMTKGNLRMTEGLFQLMACSLSLREVRTGTWGRNPEAGTETRPWRDSVYWLALPMVCSACFLIQLRTTSPRWALNESLMMLNTPQICPGFPL